MRKLTALGLASPQRSKRLFASELADLIDISDAIELSQLFGNLDAVTAADESVTAQAADALFEQHRAEMLAFIDSSFVTDTEEATAPGRAAFRLPVLREGALISSEALPRYQRFYTLHQSELERRVAVLRMALLERLQSVNDALAQVAAVEIALGPILAKYSRRCLASMPKLVATRFEQSLLQHGQPKAVAAGTTPSFENDWLQHFHEELRQLLHAELALRLQPLEGMLDCLNPDDRRENL